MVIADSTEPHHCFPSFVFDWYTNLLHRCSTTVVCTAGTVHDF